MYIRTQPVTPGLYWCKHTESNAEGLYIVSFPHQNHKFDAPDNNLIARLITSTTVVPLSLFSTDCYLWWDKPLLNPEIEAEYPTRLNITIGKLENQIAVYEGRVKDLESQLLIEAGTTKDLRHDVAELNHALQMKSDMLQAQEARYEVAQKLIASLKKDKPRSVVGVSTYTLEGEFSTYARTVVACDDGCVFHEDNSGCWQPYAPIPGTIYYANCKEAGAELDD